MLEIPHALIEEVQRGRVVLVLGAGASIGAIDDKGQGPPNGIVLRDLLSDRFLGGAYKSESLSWVAELAINETSLVVVQEFIADLLRHLRPAPFHKVIPTFRWRGIATTNYDLVMETAYSACANRIQLLVPFISDRDQIDEKLQAGGLAYLKLHGCISRTHEPELPLILTVEHYISHRSRRKYLFDTLESLAYQYPVVFVGSSGQDSDLRALLTEASRDEGMRPRHYFLKPGITAPETRLWETKRITALDGTFEQFISGLEISIPKEMRPILSAVDLEHPIKRHFVVEEDIGSQLQAFLTNDVEYVHSSLAVGDGTAGAFYRGFDLGWYPITNGLDVPRRLCDTLMYDVVIQAEEDRPTVAEFYVIKAEAGAGKSVLLRRLAWEAATQADCICVFVREFGTLRYEGLKELYRVAQRRVFVFVDGALDHATPLRETITRARRDQLPITVFTAERANAWNVSADRLDPLVTTSFQLRYMNQEEIETLVNLLRKHDSLGNYLSKKTHQECIQQFNEQAGRQILVALHEATMGVPFEQILIDEYVEIEPRAAQQLYLTVCVLNRLGVPVRAGLIARVHGVQFEEFTEHFFKPLEHVVRTQVHPGTGDYLYTARHPEIAQIVFERVLKSSRDRFSEYIRVISSLNLAYNTDRDALRGLLRAKSLHELFPNYEEVKALFDAAIQVGPRESYIYQQLANYERIRPDGNLPNAIRLLQLAQTLDPRDSSLLHTLAEVKRTQAENAKHRLEREKFRNESRALLRTMMSDTPNDRYANVTMLKLAIDDLRDVLTDQSSNEREIDNGIRKVEEIIQHSLQRFPGDSFLLVAEADYGRLLNDDERTYKALRKAFETNRRDTFIASRLAKVCEGRGEFAEARTILHDALQAHRGDQNLNFQYAQALRRHGDVELTTFLYHFKRAFTKGDSNFEAQFWYARYLFESADLRDHKESKELFKSLRSAPVTDEVRRKVQDIASEHGNPKLFYGSISRLDFTNATVQLDGSADWIFVHKNDVDAPVWNSLVLGVRVSLHVGFTFAGATAVNLRVL